MSETLILNPTSGVSPGGVYVWNESTGLWTLSNTGLPSGAAWGWTAADTADPVNRWIVAFSSAIVLTGTTGIVGYVTSNGGVTWSAITVNIAGFSTATAPVFGVVTIDRLTVRGVVFMADGSGDWAILVIGYNNVTGGGRLIVIRGNGTTGAAAQSLDDAIRTDGTRTAAMINGVNRDVIVSACGSLTGSSAQILRMGYAPDSGTAITMYPDVGSYAGAGNAVALIERLEAGGNDAIMVRQSDGVAFGSQDYTTTNATSLAVSPGLSPSAGASTGILVGDRSSGVAELTDPFGTPAVNVIHGGGVAVKYLRVDRQVGTHAAARLNSDDFYYYNGSVWSTLAGPGGSLSDYSEFFEVVRYVPITASVGGGAMSSAPKLPTYQTLPSLPERGPLPPSVSVILPLARTNLVANPSFETNTTGWTDTTGNGLARSSNGTYYGIYGLQVSPSSDATGVYYGPITLANDTVYAVSIQFKAFRSGLSFDLSVRTTAGVALQTQRIRATGRWQRIVLFYHEQTGAARRIYVTSAQAGNSFFYIDGAQVEPISDGILQATTYIDGDQRGLLVGQQPPPYGWTGTPHASTSYRTGATRAGGYVMNLQSAYGFLLTGMIGIGMAAPNNISIPYSVLDGARYLRTQKPPRTISLPGRFQGDTLYDLATKQSAMRAAFDRDLVPLQQPMVLQVEPVDECGDVIGDTAQIQCLYAGGLEGDQSNYPVEEAAPTFTMYAPYLIGGSAGAALTEQSSVANTRGIIKRTPDGVWSAVGAGVSAGNPVYSILVARDGKIYAGGGFTAMSGVANTARIAYFDPADSAWHAMGTGGASDEVFALAEGPDGSIYAGGTFSGMGGVANTKCIARWDGSAWQAMGTGGVAATTSVRALAFDGNGSLYVGGNFTDIGGSGADYLAAWNGAWFVIGSATAINGTVYALASYGNRYGMYIGGAFTNAGGIANADYITYWEGLAYNALSTGMNNDVQTIVVQPSGIVYAGGAFTVAGGQTVTYNAAWNGTAWSAFGSGLNALMYDLTDGPGQSVYFGGAFSTAGGFTLNDGLVLWTGSAFAFPDIDYGLATFYAIATAPDGTIYFGSDGTGPAIAAGVTTLLNENKQIVYPTFTISGPTSGSSRIYNLINVTTDAVVYLDLVIVAGETITLTTDPQNPSFRSNVRGDISGTMLSGSTPAQFYFVPGNNAISLFAEDSSVVALVSWQRQYNGYADLIN